MPKEINHRTARMKAAAPVNPTDCRDKERSRYDEWKVKLKDNINHNPNHNIENSMKSLR